MASEIDPETAGISPQKPDDLSHPEHAAPKSLALAIGLTVLWPGAGYVYFGRKVIGILTMIIMPFVIFLMPQVIVLCWAVMIIDLVILNSKAKREVEALATKPCPHCAEKVQMAAKVCRYCGRDI
jgi:hypothetical protein